MGDVTGQTERLEGYRLVERLASSAEARVHRARGPDDRAVVVKVYEPGAAELAGLAELRLAGVRHPGLLTCHHAGRTIDGRRLFTVAEDVAGSPAAPGAAVSDLGAFTVQLLAAVGFLHGLGLLHRDLKADNVLIEPRSGRPVVIDFGFACAPDEVAARPVAGTPRAMAPELFAGGLAGVASDLWACGLLVAELALGRPLFTARDASGLRAERESFAGLPDEVAGPAPLRALLERLLAPDPAARPEDAGAALAALAEACPAAVGRVLAEDLRGARTAALARHDPARAAEREGLAAGACWVRPLQGLDEDDPAPEALARLVEWARTAEPPGDALAGRLAAFERRAPARPVRLAELTALLEAVAEGGPLVVGLDDPAGAFAREWARQLEAAPRVEVLGLAGPDARAALAALADWLGPQPVLEERLAEALPPTWDDFDEATEALVAGGVVTRTVAGLRVDEARLPRSWPVLDEVPDPVASLEASERAVYDLVALAPRPLPAPACAHVLGRGVEGDLERLIGRGLLVEEPGGGTLLYRVADARLARRRAASTGAAPRRRLAAWLAERVDLEHERGAAALAQVLDEVVAGDEDPTPLSRAALSAAQTLRRVGRLSLAATTLRRALDGTSDEGALRRELMLALVDVLVRAARHDDALAVLDEADQHFPRDDGLAVRRARVLQYRGQREDALALLPAERVDDLSPDDAVEWLRTRVDLLSGLGRLDEARADAREALRRLGDVPDRRRMLLLERAGTIEEALHHHDEAVRHYERAIAMAEELGQQALIGSFQFNMGRAIRNRGDKRRGLALQEEAAARTERAGDVVNLCMQLNSIGAGWLTMGWVDAARRHLARALELARRVGDEQVEAMVLNNTARALVAEGRREEAEERFEASLALRARNDDPRGQAAVRLTRAGTLLDVGDHARARADLDAARVCLAGVSARDWSLEADLLEARLLLETGRLAEAAARLPALVESAAAAGKRAEQLRARTLLARAGGRDLEDVDPDAEERGPWLARLLFTRAARRHDEGRGPAADDDVAQALSILGETPDGPIEAAGLVTRLRIDLERLDAMLGTEGSDLGDAGRLLSRATRDRERALALVQTHGLRPLVEPLEALGARLDGLQARLGTVGAGALVERLASLERVAEITKAMAGERDTQRLLDLIVDSAIELTGAARGFLILFDGRAHEFRAARNIDERTIRDPDFHISHSVAQGVVRSGEPLLTDNAIADPRLMQATSISELQLLSILCVPLVSRARVLGAIYLDHPRVVGRFDERHLSAVTALAEQAAIALQNARLAEGLEHTNVKLRDSQDEIRRLNEALQDRLLQREAELERVQESLAASRRALERRYDYSNIVTRSHAMAEVLDQLDRVTGTHFPVIIQGESGTGKELIARALHFNGPRRDRPFVSINCAAIVEPLIESELFGSVKGAFTGADRDRKGLFEQADTGTLFLDEIGDMSTDVQKRLLRVLQEGEFIPVGGREARTVDVRVLCATHRDLTDMIASGGFREDLYYRLAVGRVLVPPLRERLEDIAVLLPHFIERHQGGLRLVEPEAITLLEQHRWPGNVRELENFAMNVILLEPDATTVGPDTVRRLLRVPGGIGPDAAEGAAGAAEETGDGSLKERMEAYERRQIRAALERAGGNKSRAARELGINVRSLYKILARLGIG